MNRKIVQFLQTALTPTASETLILLLFVIETESLISNKTTKVVSQLTYFGISNFSPFLDK